MLTRAASIDANGEKPSKHRKIDALGDAIDDARLTSLCGLKDDFAINILSFLHFEDLNSFVICSQCCHEARNDSLLNQTRTGTIVFSEGSTCLAIYDAIMDHGWSSIFQGN